MKMRRMSANDQRFPLTDLLKNEYIFNNLNMFVFLQFVLYYFTRL